MTSRIGRKNRGPTDDCKKEEFLGQERFDEQENAVIHADGPLGIYIFDGQNQTVFSSFISTLSVHISKQVIQ